MLLGLLWWSDRLEEQEAVEHLIESITEPERLRRKRRVWRRGSLIFFFGLSLAFVYAGYRGVVIELLPAHYLGYFFLVVIALGVAGVNIW